MTIEIFGRDDCDLRTIFGSNDIHCRCRLEEIVGQIGLKRNMVAGAQCRRPFQCEDIRIEGVIHFIVDSNGGTGNNAKPALQNLIARLVFDESQPRG